MKIRTCLYIGLTLLVSFVLWTVLVRVVDVKPIGPDGSEVGFATLNAWFHNLTGVHMFLYTVTDWMSLIPLGFVFLFGTIGLGQWIHRKCLACVDRSLLCLGVFYIATLAAFIFFEAVPVNFRPVLIEGVLEASYPSSTTLLVLCVMPTVMIRFSVQIHNRFLNAAVVGILIIFTVFMVTARIVSGVHWITDIIGGALLSGGLVTVYSCMPLSTVSIRSIM